MQALQTSPLGLSGGAVLESSESGTRYSLVRRLGAGSFGQVWLCRTAEGEARAAKVLPEAEAENVAMEVVQAKRATEMVGPHHVPKFYEAASCWVQGRPRDGLLLIAMEFIDGASAGHLAAKSPAPELVHRMVIHDVTIALSRLHECGIIHRDVKGDNILVSKSGQSYLCDFGVSSFKWSLRKTDGRMETCGTIPFMAPETVGEEPEYNEKIDIWSLGIAAIELASGITPMQRAIMMSHDQEELFLNIATQMEPEVPEDIGYSHAFGAFVDRCLVRMPEERASAQELLRCKYLRGLGETGYDHVSAWWSEGCTH